VTRREKVWTLRGASGDAAISLIPDELWSRGVATSSTSGGLLAISIIAGRSPRGFVPHKVLQIDLRASPVVGMTR